MQSFDPGPPGNEELHEGDGTAVGSLVQGPGDDQPESPRQSPIVSAERGSSHSIKTTARALTHHLSDKSSVRAGAYRLLRSSYTRYSK
eukprot:6141169-Alexandrium_andersonii.AAC.1